LTETYHRLQSLRPSETEAEAPVAPLDLWDLWSNAEKDNKDSAPTSVGARATVCWICLVETLDLFALAKNSRKWPHCRAIFHHFAMNCLLQNFLDDIALASWQKLKDNKDVRNSYCIENPSTEILMKFKTGWWF